MSDYTHLVCGCNLWGKTYYVLGKRALQHVGAKRLLLAQNTSAQFVRGAGVGVVVIAHLHASKCDVSHTSRPLLFLVYHLDSSCEFAVHALRPLLSVSHFGVCAPRARTRKTTLSEYTQHVQFTPYTPICAPKTS